MIANNNVNLEKLAERHALAVKIAQDLCEKNDAQLLYLTVFGAELYGTNTGKSDLDARGLFLPSLQSVMLERNPKSLHYSTGREGARNSSVDMDIDLWSLQYWLLTLLPAGDTGALDLLFSPSNSACALFKSPLLDSVFANPGKFLNLANNRAYAEYSLSQAKKYGIKGSRLGALRTVWKWLEAHETEGRLENHLKAILEACGDEKYCFSRLQPDGDALVLCGKIHTGRIRMREFRERVVKDMERFGERAKAAEANQGLDFKALSHAMRALEQMEELLLTGKIKFPLKMRDELVRIKKGEIPWPQLETLLLARLGEINRLTEKLAANFTFDREYAESILLRCYGMNLKIANSEALPVVERELSKISKEYNVKILFACEAGSRAWGFESLDSDYDIRFVYIHERNWYLGASPESRRNVIEKTVIAPEIGVLDMSGWELRKALKIAQKGNPQVAEWVLSPIIYKYITDFSALLKQALPEVLSMGGIWHHYYGLLYNSYKKIGGGNQSAKALLYVIRPLLALLWIEKGFGVPPVKLVDLMAGTVEDAEIKKQMLDLIERKKYSREQDNEPAGKKLMAWLNHEYERLNDTQPKLDYKRAKLNVDAIFMKILEQSQLVSE